MTTCLTVSDRSSRRPVSRPSNLRRCALLFIDMLLAMVGRIWAKVWSKPLQVCRSCSNSPSESVGPKFGRLHTKVGRHRRELSRARPEFRRHHTKVGRIQAAYLLSNSTQTLPTSHQSWSTSTPGLLDAWQKLAAKVRPGLGSVQPKLISVRPKLVRPRVGLGSNKHGHDADQLELAPDRVRRNLGWFPPGERLAFDSAKVGPVSVKVTAKSSNARGVDRISIHFEQVSAGSTN